MKKTRGVHGKDEAAVYKELCKVAEEWIATLHEDGVRVRGRFSIRHRLPNDERWA